MSDAPVLADVLEVLRGKRSAVRANKFDIVGVFGSVARGEARPDSDIDIVIEAIDPGAGLLDMGAIWSDLSEALGRKVDLLELDAVGPTLRAAVRRDLAPL